LETPLEVFFDGLATSTSEVEREGVSEVMSFLNERGSHELMAAFMDMTPALRSHLVALALALADSKD
jgi:hypothetical protein